MSLGRLVSANLLLKSTTRGAARFRPTAGFLATRHAQTLKPQPSVTVGLAFTRSLSLWGSRSTPSSAPPATPSPPPVAPEEIIEGFPQQEIIAETPPIPESTTSISELVTSLDIPQTINITPLNYGDLAALGFSNFTPAGVVQWTMELIQVSSGMSWLWTIVTITVLSRLIVLPFNINSVRATARLAPHQPRLMQLRNELQQTGGLTNDPIAVQRISLQQKKIYEEAGVSILTPLLTPIIQIPVSLGLFFGIKKLCDFPLEQLKTGGFGWITDLTAADPLCALPIAMALMVNVQLSVGAKDITDDTAQTRHFFNVFKVLSFVSVPVMMNLPAGVTVYFFTTAATIVAQSLILRNPSVRKALDIPRIPDHMRTKPPTFLETVKAGVDWYKSRTAEAQARARTQERKKY